MHAGPPGASSGRATPLLARWQSGAQGPCSCCCHPCRHGTRLARRRRQSKGPGERLGQCTPGPLAPPQAAPHPCLLGGNPAPRGPAPAAATRAGTAPGWPADAGRARGRARDLVSARRAPWRLLRPRHTPACSVAIRRPGALLLLLPPVPARHPAGPPTPAEQAAGRETWSVHAGPPGASSGRATPLLARWQSGAQGPCSCCCHPCRHGTRLARRRRQSKGPGERLGQCTPGPLAPPQAAPHPCLLGVNPAPRGPAPAAATRAGTAPGWPADAGRARGRARDLVSARRAPWRLLRPRHTPACSVAFRRPGALLLLLPPVPARHPAGPPTPAEQWECTSSFRSGMAVAFRLRKIQYTREGGNIT